MSISRFRHTATESIIATILLLAFSYQVVNKVVFTHSHILIDGTVIVHAHPYDKTDKPGPVNNHTHTKNEFWLLSINNLLFSSFSIFIFFLFKYYEKRIISIKPFYHSHLGINDISNKSPPLY